MKRFFNLFLIAIVATTACRKIEVDGTGGSNNGGGNSGGGNTTGQTIVLEGKINKDTVLRAINTYILKGLVFMTNNTTMTIEPGTNVKGQFNDPIGGLVITRGSKLIADGTLDKPIVFTSSSPTPRSGDWAGIVLLGKAPTNASFNGQAGVGEIEGGINDAAGNGLYGGADANDNSGILRYVRIEYAGFAFLPDKEINSLTMGGVGAGTTIDYVQVTYAKDDAFEWFGGTVNCKHLIAYKTQDDDFDTDNGYSGKVQFGLIIRDSSVADISRSEAFESDNDANGSTIAPLTAPIFSNITAIGPLATLNNNGSSLFLAGAHIRRNSQLSIFNSVFLGWPVAILLDGSRGRPTDLNLADSTLRLRNNIFAGNKVNYRYAASSTVPTGATDATITALLATFNNSTLTNVDDARITSPFNYNNYDFQPFGTSPAATGGLFADPKLNGFTAVPFRGAIGPSGADATWHKGWTRFN
jgi:hypothetical protein